MGPFSDVSNCLCMWRKGTDQGTCYGFAPAQGT